jgi:hypothetical protein
MVSTAVEVTDDRFDSDIRFTGANREENPGSLDGTFWRRSMLRSWMNKETGRVTHQLYVAEVYGGRSWRGWGRANDQSATSLNFTAIRREAHSCMAGRCGYTEFYGASIDDARLRANRGGYCVKFYARNGEEHVVCLTADQIAAQLAAIDARRPRSAPQVPRSPAPTFTDIEI